MIIFIDTRLSHFFLLSRWYNIVDMFPNQNSGQGMSAIAEAMRRRMGQQPSAAGMPGANVNPMARSPQAVQRPSGATGSSPLMMDQMQKSQPGEAMTIIKALLARLRDLPPEQGNL